MNTDRQLYQHDLMVEGGGGGRGRGRGVFYILATSRKAHFTLATSLLGKAPTNIDGYTRVLPTGNSSQKINMLSIILLGVGA